MTDIPAAVNFRVLTEDDSPSAFFRAAAMTMSRDMLWENPHPLAETCPHDLQCLPVVEFRQTVICRKCGGLDVGLSRELTASPGAFTISEEGDVARA